MKLHTPPENQGQTIEVSYGWRDGALFRRTHDRSSSSTTWERARESKALRDYQESSSELWNERPPKALTWAKCEEPR